MAFCRDHQGNVRFVGSASRARLTVRSPSVTDASLPRARLEQLARTGQPHLRPIYAAMLDPGIALLMVQQKIGRFAVEAPRGFVAIIGDDTDRALGPAGFHRKSVRRLAAQTCSIAIIASDIVPDVYETAAALAALGRGALIIETRPEQEGAWMDLMKTAAPRTPILLCTPIAGTA